MAASSDGNGTKRTPWIKADLTGICNGHWADSGPILRDFLGGLAVEALMHDVPMHIVRQAMEGIASELAGGRIGKYDVAELVRFKRLEAGIVQEVEAVTEAEVVQPIEVKEEPSEVAPIKEKERKPPEPYYNPRLTGLYVSV
jgi:hypothetical protein